MLKTNNFSETEELILINFLTLKTKYIKMLWIKSNEELSIINEHRKEIKNKIEKSKKLTDLEFLSFYKQFDNEKVQKLTKYLIPIKKNTAIAEEIKDISKMQKSIRNSIKNYL